MTKAKAKTQATAEDDVQQSIEELTERYKKLDREKTVAETNLKNARQQLDELKKTASERYGTDDAEELKKQLKDMQEENERKRAQYQKKLEKIETELDTVKKKYGSLETPCDDEAVPH